MKTGIKINEHNVTKLQAFVPEAVKRFVIDNPNNDYSPPLV